MSHPWSHFLQVEAVNLDSTLFDTDQLSVIRGGSFLVADAMCRLLQVFPDDLERLSIGASVGLYEIKGDADPAGIKERVIDWLRADDDCGLFTFAVALCRADHLQTAKAELTAAIRVEQLRQLTNVPDRIAAGVAHQPCGLTGKRACRPDGPARAVRDKMQPVSAAVDRRWERGLRLKTDLYLTTLAAARVIAPARMARIAGFRYAADLERLAAWPTEAPDRDPGQPDGAHRLDHKIAVIYLDGNGFGDIQRRCVETSAHQIAFDDRLHEDRAEFLATLLEALIDGHFQGAPLLATRCPPDDRGEALRLETLLWGGDEMTLVVPAWLGFDVLQMFYHRAAAWQFQGERLTHAGGIVFCHAHTPIARMHQLARTLADDVKTWMKDCGNQGNYLDYMVLESIDYPVETTLAQFHAHRYGAVAARRTPLRADATWFGAGRPAVSRLLGAAGLGRGQVFRLARRIAGSVPAGPDARYSGGPGGVPLRLLEDQDPASLSDFQQLELRLLTLSRERQPDSTASGSPVPSVEDDLECLAAGFQLPLDDPADRAWLWLHLTELWDYLAPERDRSRAAPTEAAP